MEDFVTFEIAKKLKEKGFKQKCLAYYDVEDNVGLLYNTQYTDEALPCQYTDLLQCHNTGEAETQPDDSDFCVDAPTISQVLKWFRKENNIDVDIQAAAGMLGYKVYVPYISTYTEFRLDPSDDVVRYRQKKFNPTTPLPHEIIPAFVYFKEWEEAALTGIEYVLDKLI